MAYPKAESLQPYEFVRVESSKAPAGAEGAGWCRYVITQGDNTIKGHRRGSIDDVTVEVKQLVAQLNERQKGKRGRVHLVTATRDKPSEKQ